MEKQSWSSVKAKLSGKSPAVLLATIQELWNMSPQNKEFLSTKFNIQSPNQILPKYRELVRQPFFPNGPKRKNAPGRIRTSDPQIRSLVFYPAELRVHMKRLKN